MKITSMRGRLVLVASAALAVAASVGAVRAHCDTLQGPVVAAARAALERGEVTPVLRWVHEDHEAEIREAFERVRAVRSLGGEAKSLADLWFFETLVRIHREGEGAPYTGLKPAEAVDPAVALADRALEDGNIETLVGAISAHAAEGIRDRFRRARETAARASESVEAGRRHVAAYVEFTHYVEALHTAAVGTAHAHGDAPHDAARSKHGGAEDTHR